MRPNTFVSVTEMLLALHSLRKRYNPFLTEAKLPLPATLNVDPAKY